MARVLAVAAPANGSGKTRLLATIVAARPGALTSLKITTVYRDGENCPRTERACACRELHGRFTVVGDPAILLKEGTDTGRLAAAGAARVLWALAVPGAHPALWAHLTSELLGADEAVATEGSRILSVIEPEALVSVMSPSVPRERWKDDAWPLAARSALVVVNLPPGADRAAADALAGEAAARTAAQVVVQDVAAPLHDWADPALIGILDRLLAPAPAAPVRVSRPGA